MRTTGEELSGSWLLPSMRVSRQELQNGYASSAERDELLYGRDCLDEADSVLDQYHRKSPTRKGLMADGGFSF